MFPNFTVLWENSVLYSFNFTPAEKDGQEILYLVNFVLYEAAIKRHPRAPQTTEHI